MAAATARAGGHRRRQGRLPLTRLPRRQIRCPQVAWLKRCPRSESGGWKTRRRRWIRRRLLSQFW